jgi:hypothetical protein
MSRVRSPLIFVLALAILAAAGSSLADTRHAVHLASYHSEADAQAGWQELVQSHPTLLRGSAHRIVRVDLPGKGTYYRVMAGVFKERSQALKLQDAVRGLGLYAEAMPLPAQLPVQAQGPYRLPAPRRLATPPPAIPATPTAPHSPAVASAPDRPAAPRTPTPPAAAPSIRPTAPPSVKNSTAPLHPATPNSPLPRPEPAENVTSLRKFVAPPEVTTRGRQARTSNGDPLAGGAVREQTATSAPPSSSFSTSPRTSFRDDGSSDSGLTLARPRSSPGRIAAIYGDMGNDFEEIPGAVNMKHLRRENEFKPYLGLGISF